NGPTRQGGRGKRTRGAGFKGRLGSSAYRIGSFPDAMARDGAVYACQSCGAVQTKWAGQCPACGAWNTLVEELQARPPGAMAPSKASKARGLAFEGLQD